MFTPARQRNLALITTVAAVSVALAGIYLVTTVALQQWLVAGGATIALMALGLALAAQGDVRRLNRLLRGEGVIARWRVMPDVWQRFVAESRAWEARPGITPNGVATRGVPPPGGFEVIVSDQGVLLGRRFYGMAKDVTVQLHPRILEFEHIIQKPGAGVIRLAYRFPIAPGAEADAERIRSRYASARAAAGASPRFKIYVIVGLIGLVGLATLITLLGGN